MPVDWLTTLYDYNSATTERILDAAAGLTDDQLQAPGGQGYDSIRDTLVHLVFAQWLWFSRLQGASPRDRWRPADFPDLAAIRARWREVDADTRAFVAALDPARLGEVIHHTTMSGAPRAERLDNLLLHIANHGTQHRSEVAYLLTQHGRSPGDLDLVYYLDAMRGG